MEAKQNALRSALDLLAARVPNVHVITLSQLDGAVLARTQLQPGKMQPYREDYYTAAFAFAKNEIQLVGLGQVKSITTRCGNFILVHINCTPNLVVSVLGDLNMNIGLLSHYTDELQRIAAAATQQRRSVA